jgi:uncharacterized protein DUF6812
MFSAQEPKVAVTLHTDAYVIRGQVASRQRRVTDILNDVDHDFLVLTDAVLDEYGAHGGTSRADFAQVNLASVLFAIADAPVESAPEMRTPKVQEEALISIPPFKIIGQIHLMPEHNLRDALAQLTGRFVPVTDATYWSDTLGEARTSSALVAFNRSRAQILAPHRAVDPWEGIQGGAAGGGANPPRDPTGGW